MNAKLIAFDIDDTLLNSAGKILDSTKAAVKKALENDIKVVLCSGRPLAGVQSFLEELEIVDEDQYVITFNGAVIESVTGHLISKSILTNDIYRSIVNFADQHHVPYNVLDENSTIYTSNLDVNWITVVQAWENLAGILIRTPDQLPSDFSIVKAVFVGEIDELDQIESMVHAAFDNQCYVVRAAPNFLELMHQDVNKGAALKALSEKLNIAPEEVIVFGDEKNDLPMFDFAGTAVAMGNGSSFMKQRADFVTKSNDEDGIAFALNELNVL